MKEVASAEALGVSDLRRFEQLMANGGSEHDVLQFLEELRSDPEPSFHGKNLIHAFSGNGVLRNQIQFLCDLHREGIYIDRQADSEAAVIYFGGLIDPAGLALARSRLSQTKASGIYLFDNQNLNYAVGVKQCGANMRETTDYLKRALEELGAKRIITVGNSAGGFAAINYGMSLNAYASVTFSPFTTFALQHQTEDQRAAGIIDRWKKLAPELLIDIVPSLARHRPPLKVLCFFAEGMKQDAWHARRLKGVPNTIVVPVPKFQGHYILGPLVKAGVFDSVMLPLTDGADLESCVRMTLAQFSPKPASPPQAN